MVVTSTLYKNIFLAVILCRISVFVVTCGNNRMIQGGKEKGLNYLNSYTLYGLLIGCIPNYNN